MAKKISPLAPKSFPEMPVIKGLRLGAVNCGIRYKKRYDLMFVELAEGTTVAGVFTKSSMPGAPVDWCKSILRNGKARGLVVNSGISNVFTGEAGRKTVERTVKAAATLLKCKPYEIYVSSTGIIGVPIKDELLVGSIPKTFKKLKATSWLDGAKAILTTDTFPKGSTRKVRIGGVEVIINGIAKGSGMIAPNMATMLGYIFTDAKIPAPILQKIFSKTVEKTFNSITVDSDTSTSDTVLIFATGTKKHNKIDNENDNLLKDFKIKLEEVMRDLAHQVVKDGEGAKKFISINIKGATSEESARKIGFSIANSPLVKTALAAGDANWGRIVAAVGKSGEKAERDSMSIWIGKALIATNGSVNPNYTEGPTAKYMKGKNIDIIVDVGMGGKGFATVWTCDLTHEYISINADYRS